MATLTPTLTLSSTDVTSDTLSISITDSLTIAGDVQQSRIALTETGIIILDSSGTTISPDSRSWVYMKHTGTSGTDKINIQDDVSGTNIQFSLLPGEFCWVPWNGTDVWYADMSANTATLEMFVFEVA